LVPQRQESGGLPGASVDGTALPLNSPEQFIQVAAEEVAALLASEQTKHHPEDRIEENI
jgi:hypothetical protein